MATRRRPGAADSRCPACQTPTLTQWVGDRAAVHVTADLTPLTPEQQAAARSPNRLIWCLVQAPHGAPRLRWITSWHPTSCPHPHVTEHHCNPEPTTLF